MKASFLTLRKLGFFLPTDYSFAIFCIFLRISQFVDHKTNCNCRPAIIACIV